LLGQFNFNKKEKRGKAKVFGYTVINGITHNLTGEAKEYLLSKLDVESFDKGDSLFDGGMDIERVCGSYSIGGIAYIKNTLEEIVKVLEEVEEKFGIKPKVFFNGGFHSLNEFNINGVEFTRSLTKVETDTPIEDIQGEKKKVIFINNYKKGK
jgi:hypothetical protein